MEVPGTTEVLPSVWEMDKSTRGVRVSTSEAVLFATFKSSTLFGAVMVTELVNVPVAEVETVPVRFKVMLFPEVRVIPPHKPVVVL